MLKDNEKEVGVGQDIPIISQPSFEPMVVQLRVVV